MGSGEPPQEPNPHWAAAERAQRAALLLCGMGQCSGTPATVRLLEPLAAMAQRPDQMTNDDRDPDMRAVIRALTSLETH
jgi:hypothetical protein